MCLRELGGDPRAEAQGGARGLMKGGRGLFTRAVMGTRLEGHHH